MPPPSTLHARRRFLQGGLAAGSIFLPVPWAWVWAQSEGATRLLRAPKLALVMGNGSYRHVPALRNPDNDARAVAEALRSAGFEATLVQDATRERMVEAIGTHARGLAARKAVGLFYFAGHGLQLKWQNYLLPVDARVTKAGDVASQCVDVGALMDGIRKAENPMNVIILDACRDNPFGAEVHADRKGLSQADAPTGSLLAYATAPGNTADDGAGAHGLYTEHLLREIRAPETRIEDVFKRVRLGVRRASGGRQVPWESTSLEEDFYFFPLGQPRKPSLEEAERAFREELAAYEHVAGSRDPVALEGYLRRYPSGRFAELAQLRLDAALAAAGERPVAAAAARGNPYTAGTERARLDYKVGDRYAYRFLDRVKGAPPIRVEEIVTAVTDDEVTFNDGKWIFDRLGNVIRRPDGRRYTPRQDKPLEYAVGRRWTTRYGVTRGDTYAGRAETEFRIAAKERIRVPVGEFDCYRIEANGVSRAIDDFPGSPYVEGRVTYWMAPGVVRRVVAYDETFREIGGRGRVLADWRVELDSFSER